jgi:hypothetical protein
VVGVNFVHKFELAITDRQIINLTPDAELLHVAVQRGKLCLWARVSPSLASVKREIIIHGTGHAVGRYPHVGSVLMADGELVWHVFDGGEV